MTTAAVEVMIPSAVKVRSFLVWYCLKAHEFRCRFSKSMLAYVVYSDFGVIAVSMADYRAIIGVVGSCPRFFNLWREPSLIWT